MAKSEYLKIQLDSPDGIYFAGQLIKGTLIITFPIAIQVQEIGILMIGESRTHWVNKTSDSIFDSYEPYFNNFIDLSWYLKQATDGDSLLEGKHQFDFSYQLPHGLPSSFEDEFGFTRYRCVAKVVIGKMDITRAGCFMPDFQSTEHLYENVFKVIVRTSPGCYNGHDVPMTKEETIERLGMLLCCNC